jgi:peptidoglycan/xylan/chitin deacetylase (PgdA/CDA1 family)
LGQGRPVEIHDRLLPDGSAQKRVALTLDACTGHFDEDLIEFLIRNRIPATLFVTKKWLDANPHGVAVIRPTWTCWRSRTMARTTYPP